MVSNTSTSVTTYLDGKPSKILQALIIAALLLLTALPVPRAAGDELQFVVDGGGIVAFTTPGGEMLLEVNHYKESPFGEFDEAIFYMQVPPYGYVPILILVDNAAAAAFFTGFFGGLGLPTSVNLVEDTNALQVTKYRANTVQAIVPFDTPYGPTLLGLNFERLNGGKIVQIRANVPGLEAGTQDREAIVTSTLPLAIHPFDPADIFLPGAVISVRPQAGEVQGLVRISSNLVVSTSGG